MIIVSECLLGVNCKYSGGNNENLKVIEFLKNKNYCAVCPEQLGGLSTPRLPSEIKSDRVYSKEGKDITREFELGRDRALKIIKEKEKELSEPVEMAILKAKSPSCGSNIIYDGSFSGKKIAGNGIFVRALKEKGIPVFTENDIFE